jgi:hypothetical protein
VCYYLSTGYPKGVRTTPLFLTSRSIDHVQENSLCCSAFRTFAAGVNAQPFAADMTRQQVQEDLAAWRQSGLEALSRGESGPDTFSPQYQAAFQRYLQLTQGDMYQAPSAGKTRAEVMADLELWKISGMHAFTSRGITTASHTCLPTSLRELSPAQAGCGLQGSGGIDSCSSKE